MTIVEAGQNVLSSSISIYKEPTESFQNPPEPVISASKGTSFIMSSNSGMNSRVKHEDNREFVCGWGAAFINITVTFPMNKIMFRQMLHGISTARAVAQLKKEGVKNLYRGILPPLCQKTISTSVMFGMFEQYGQFLRQYLPGLSPGVNMATSASLAGCTEAVLCPLERIQTVLQDRKFHGMYKNTLHCAKAFARHGFTEYYRGLYLIFVRNSISNIMFFGLRKEIKEAVPTMGKSWYESILGDFISGAILGAFISTVVYPLNVVKAHQQCQVRNSLFEISFSLFLL
ncbi:Thioredoxin-related transmembrane protein 2-like protein [Armadillidium vulgare]|nr:Thioredoxin-related transmembrane protein 2-like protein [Armadillidium vulgare]